jgi:hypothetical protein
VGALVPGGMGWGERVGAAAEADVVEVEACVRLRGPGSYVGGVCWLASGRCEVDQASPVGLGGACWLASGGGEDAGARFLRQLVIQG